MSTPQAVLSHLRRNGVPTLLAAAALLLAAGPAAAVGPTPVTVTGGPVATMAAPATPFMANVYINITAGNALGDFNNNFNGPQSVAVPAGKRLVVQAMSAYRYGSSPSGSSLQVYVDAPTNGQVGAWALPPIVANGTQYPGVSQPLVYYVDGGSRFLVNAYRNSNGANESVQVSISGYLVDAP
jgi:hypothetical protein